MLCHLKENESALNKSGIPGLNSRSKKLHTCELCAKRFRCQAHLDRHKRIHTGQRPFPCNASKINTCVANTKQFVSTFSFSLNRSVRCLSTSKRYLTSTRSVTKEKRNFVVRIVTKLSDTKYL